MSDVIFLSDTHFGYRIDNDDYTNHVKRFFRGEFFPYIKEYGITEVIQFGDLLDNRVTISTKTLELIKDEFFTPLEKAGVTLRIFLGNHDIYYKNTSVLETPSHIIEKYSNIILHKEFDVVQYDDVKFGIVPWINKGNVEEYNRWIKLVSCDILLGHFELSGFEYLKGVMATKGLDPITLKDFDAVYSGHYHTASKIGNVHYLGTPYEMTFADMDDDKGFWVFDTKTRELERVKSNLQLFKKINYDDENTNYDEFPFEEYGHCYIKVNVITRNNVDMYNRFIDKLYTIEAIDITVNDIDIGVDDTEDETNLESQTTIQIMNDTIREVENINTDNVLGIVNTLYKEATLSEGSR